MTTIPFEPRRFRSTVDYYAKYRVPYPDDLIGLVAARIGIRAGSRVLDLGCGPGPLALAFARLGAEVTAMDPEPDMLAAVQAAASAGNLSVTVRQGSSYDLTPDMGPFRAVVMGRSFHWMDRIATLATLDRLIEPEGCVALFHDRRVLALPDWAASLERLATEHSPERMQARQIRRGPGWQPHEAVLLRSAFHHLERIGRVVERTLDADAIVGRAYSMSVSSPEALGERRDAFEAALRAALAELAPDGVFSEVVDVDAMLAFRGAPASPYQNSTST